MQIKPKNILHRAERILRRVLRLWENLFYKITGNSGTLSKLYFGSDVPGQKLGKPGDMYSQLNRGLWWRFPRSGWVAIFDLIASRTVDHLSRVSAHLTYTLLADKQVVAENKATAETEHQLHFNNQVEPWGLCTADIAFSLVRGSMIEASGQVSVEISHDIESSNSIVALCKNEADIEHQLFIYGAAGADLAVNMSALYEIMFTESMIDAEAEPVIGVATDAVDDIAFDYAENAGVSIGVQAEHQTLTSYSLDATTEARAVAEHGFAIKAPDSMTHVFGISAIDYGIDVASEAFPNVGLYGDVDYQLLLQQIAAASLAVNTSALHEIMFTESMIDAEAEPVIGVATDAVDDIAFDYAENAGVSIGAQAEHQTLTSYSLDAVVGSQAQAEHGFAIKATEDLALVNTLSTIDYGVDVPAEAFAAVSVTVQAEHQTLTSYSLDAAVGSQAQAEHGFAIKATEDLALVNTLSTIDYGVDVPSEVSAVVLCLPGVSFEVWADREIDHAVGVAAHPLHEVFQDPELINPVISIITDTDEEVFVYG